MISELAEAAHPFHQLYDKARSEGVIDGLCKACAQKMGSLDAAQAQNLTILDNLSGHAGMAPYILEGYQIITF